MVEERVKHWVMTQERALQIYELIQSSLDPNNWEVLVKSENTKVPLSEFIDKAKKRVVFRPEFGNYSPSTVADDAVTILDSLNVTFDQVRNRLEDSFRSILVVNEDMDSFIKNIELEQQTKQDEINALADENANLKADIQELKEELRIKEAGIKPLTDVIEIRVAEIIKLYYEFKNIVGNEEEMKKFLPIFDKEVKTTIKLIEMRKEQVLSSRTYTTHEYAQAESRAESEEELPPEDEELANLDDTAEYKGNVDEEQPERPFIEPKPRRGREAPDLDGVDLTAKEPFKPAKKKTVEEEAMADFVNPRTGKKWGQK